MTDTSQRIAPGGIIGILGGGQLGRMTAMAAAHLGYRSHIYCPESDTPASQVTNLVTEAAYDDEAALAGFAAAVDVITLEFENIPFATAEFLAERVILRPSPAVLRVCQNRLREKDFCRMIGVPTARYAEVTGPDSLERVAHDLGRPCVLKTAEMGYDGKGQVLIAPDSDLAEAWAQMAAQAGVTQGAGNSGTTVAIAEAFVDFRMEMSVIVARGIDGSCRTYPAVENQHRNHILDQTIVPARVSSTLAERAEVIARHLAEQLGLVGLLAIEMFVTTDDQVLVNELAPRPHNSGHWSLDACATSQFEQHVRSVTGLPLGSCQPQADAVMKNLLGDDGDRWLEILADPYAKLHLYGKAEARPGRKMGHVTRLNPKS